MEYMEICMQSVVVGGDAASFRVVAPWRESPAVIYANLTCCPGTVVIINVDVTIWT